MKKVIQLSIMPLMAVGAMALSSCAGTAPAKECSKTCSDKKECKTKCCGSEKCKTKCHHKH